MTIRTLIVDDEPLAVERLLGFDGGAPAQAGLYLPEVLLAPEAMIRQLTAFDVRVSGPRSEHPIAAS